jgi:hypothetical protein
MQILPIANATNIQPPPIDGSIPSNVDRLRTIKMRTNFNPTYVPPQEQSAPLTTQINGQAGRVAETQPLSPQYAALAKQRRALQVKEKALMERERVISEQTGQSDSIALTRLKSEPLNVLLEAGVTYDQLTEAILANPGNQELHTLRRDMEAQEQRMQKMLDDRDQMAERQALAQMKRDAISLVTGGNEFELVKVNRAIPDVMRLIETQYRKTGEVLDVHEALTEVENELLKDAQRVVVLDKVRSHLIPQAPQMQRHQGIRTLTNRDTASVPMSRRARALAAFNGTLKR